MPLNIFLTFDHFFFYYFAAVLSRFACRYWFSFSPLFPWFVFCNDMQRLVMRSETSPFASLSLRIYCSFSYRPPFRYLLITVRLSLLCSGPPYFFFFSFFFFSCPFLLNHHGFQWRISCNFFTGTLPYVSSDKAFTRHPVSTILSALLWAFEWHTKQTFSAVHFCFCFAFLFSFNFPGIRGTRILRSFQKLIARHPVSTNLNQGLRERSSVIFHIRSSQITPLYLRSGATGSASRPLATCSTTLLIPTVFGVLRMRSIS